MSTVFNFLRRSAPTLAIATLLVGAWMAWHHYSTHYLHPVEEAEESAEVAEKTEVNLSPEKLAAAKVHVASVEPKTQTLSVVVPGRIAYDPSQLVSVRLGSAGILTKVNVRPGEHVEAGQVLAMMSSPEIGTARADQMQRQSELELAKRQVAWDKSRSESIRKLVEAIRAGKSAEEIRKNFTDQLIGDAREKLLSAYTDQLLAASMVSRVNDVAASGAVSGRVIDERKSNLDSRRAALQAVIEQTLFDADRQARTAQVEVEDALRRYEIATGRVTTLLGMSATAVDPNAVTSGVSDTNGQPAPPTTPATPVDLSLIEVRSPRSGTIEKRLFNENERVEAGSVLMEIADTSHLWLKADIRESQWNALGLKAGQQITCSSPALPGEQMQATVEMMGREVETQTNAIPLVARIENPYGRLRPGLYIRAELPMGETTSQIVVPDSAITTHEGQPFVFVTSDGHTFKRRDVRIGQSASASSSSTSISPSSSAKSSSGNEATMTEIIAGLSAGEQIAVQGVFELKSELLLEAEE